MEIVVHKYGGSSLATPKSILSAARRVVRKREEGKGVVVVVSAMGDATEDLLSLARKVSRDPPERELDMLLSAGERISMALLSMAVQSLGWEAISFTGSQVGILTNEEHTRARILEIKGERLREELKKGRVVIVAGFQGVSREREVTTLGRGGSDTTAVALAAALGVKRCEIFTDVEGVYAADPAVVGGAKKIDRISYDEMLELSSLGAKVVHPRAVEIAYREGIVIEVKSNFSEREGTLVEELKGMEEAVVRGVTCDREIALLSILSVPSEPGSLSQIVTTLASKGVEVKFFAHGARRGDTVDLCFIVAEKDYQKGLEILEELRGEMGAEEVISRTNVGSVSLVGVGLGRSTETLAKVFRILASAGTHIEAVSTSEIVVSCVIDEGKVEGALKELAREFELAEK